MGILDVSLSHVLRGLQCAVRLEEVLFAEVHSISQGPWNCRNDSGRSWGCWFRRVADLRIELALVEVGIKAPFIRWGQDDDKNNGSLCLAWCAAQQQIPPLRCGMTSKGTGNGDSKGKCEMRGSLHFATDDETVCCFGRDDASFSSGRRKATAKTTTTTTPTATTTADSFASLRNDKQG